MPLRTTVHWDAIRAGLSTCPSKLAAMSHRLLTLKLQEIDRQVQTLTQDRARIQALLETIPHHHSDRITR